jgi:hypothetical protein
MTPTQSAPDAVPASTAPFADLHAALVRELDQLVALREALAHQRAAVAMSSAEGVQTTCDAVQRILQALEVARRRRHAALVALGVAADAALEALVERWGAALPAELTPLRAAVQGEAEAAAREAAVTHTVLRRAVDSGEAYLQALFASASDPAPVYQAHERPAAEALPGFLLDRRA